MSEKTYEDVEMKFWNPEKTGDSIEGIYISKKEKVGENDSVVYNIRQEDGNVISVWDCVVLSSKMALLEFGTDIRIEYLGKVKPSQGREYKDYRIQRVKIQAQEPSA